MRKAYICPHCLAIADNEEDATKRYCTNCRKFGMSDEEMVAQVQDVVDQCKPIFSGQEPFVVGAALANLVAIYLAGNFIEGGALAHADFRAKLLDLHVQTVRSYLPMEEERLLAMLRERIHGEDT